MPKYNVNQLIEKVVNNSFPSDQKGQLLWLIDTRELKPALIAGFSSLLMSITPIPYTIEIDKGKMVKARLTKVPLKISEVI